MKNLHLRHVIKKVFLILMFINFKFLFAQNSIVLLFKEDKFINFKYTFTDFNNEKYYELKICNKLKLEKRNSEVKEDSILVHNTKKNQKITIRNNYTEACNTLKIKKIENIPSNKNLVFLERDNFWEYYNTNTSEIFYVGIVEGGKINYYIGRNYMLGF